MANLKEYDTDVTAYFKKVAPWASVVDSYPEETVKHIAPASIFWGITEIEPASDRDNGSGEMELQLSVTVLVAVSTQEANSELLVRELATVLIANIHKSRLASGAGYKPARVTRSAASEFEPHLDGFSVWAVEFEQSIVIGKQLITAIEFTPGKVYGGVAPNIGADHVNDYTLIYEHKDE